MLEKYGNFNKCSSMFGIFSRNPIMVFLNYLYSERGTEKMIHEKILPMQYPIITSYPMYSNLLSIISNRPKATPWIVNNFVSLFNWDRHNLFIFFQNAIPINHNAVANVIRDNYQVCPWIHFQQIHKTFIVRKWDNIVDFLIEAIDTEHYIYLILDQFYIPGYAAYKNYKYPHDVLIYGYDLQKKCFYMADNHENYKYSYFACDFSAFNEAYYLLDDAAEDYNEFNKCIQLFKLKEDLKRDDCILDLKYIKNSLSDYLSSTHSVSQWTSDQSITYGISVYDRVKKYLLEVIDDKFSINFRSFHLLWDHKKCMSFRMKYIMDNGYLDNMDELLKNYMEIEKKSLIHRNKLIKYSVSKDASILQNVIEDIDNIVLREKDILGEFLRIL
jgi:hypothetical protein